MKRQQLQLGLVLTAGLLARGAGAAPPPGAATLADVAFMAGHWIGGEAGDLSEEVWSSPEGDSMMGMWRYVEKGRAVELPLVVRGPGEAVFEGLEYGGKGSVRLTYKRGDDDTLTSVLKKKGARQEFRFRRR